MPSNASEMDGFGNSNIPKKAKRAGLYPTPTASRQLRAGYQSGTKDIFEPKDPEIFLGGTTEEKNRIAKEVRRRYAD